MSEICLVYRNSYLHGTACKLNERVDYATVVLVALGGGENKKSVGNFVNRFGIHNFIVPFLISMQTA